MCVVYTTQRVVVIVIVVLVLDGRGGSISINYGIVKKSFEIFENYVSSTESVVVTST